MHTLQTEYGMKLSSVVWWFIYYVLMAGSVEPKPQSSSLGCRISNFFGYFPFFSFTECCSRDWISFNKTYLEVALKQKVFGQHLASPIILKAVTQHMEHSKKPLVLSLHGLAGTGKNLMSRLVAESIYQNGMDSSFVHLFIATLHFPHQAELKTYKDQLQLWIKGNITKCPYSMFIFDEMDKMHPGLIDSIKPYLDYHDNIDGVSYRQAIFFFLSNSGGKEVAEVALNFWKTGRQRKDIQLVDVEKNVTLSVFNNKQCGFGYSSLISEHLVDFYVPFLPLEFKHVVQCVLAEMASGGNFPDLDAAERMVRDYSFFPTDERIFCTQGCKMVAKRLHFYL